VGVPSASDLPMLPDAWIGELTEQPVYVKPSEKVSFADQDAQGILTGGEPCRDMVQALDGYGERTAGDSARFDAMRDTQLAIVRLGERGHQGAHAAIEALRGLYLADTADEKRDTAGEFERALFGTAGNPGGAIGVALADPTPEEDKRVCDEAQAEHDQWLAQQPPPAAYAEYDTAYGEEEEEPDERVRRLFPRIDWHELWAGDTGVEWILYPLLPERRLVALFSPPEAGNRC
jgi:hypothetical protein